MKVIFLDIDGVLNDNSYREFIGNYYEDPIDEKKLDLLKKIVDKSNAKIVLSSTWRMYWEKDSLSPDSIQLNRIFNRKNLKIYDKTENFGEDRDYEILIYLAKNDVEEYIILDDFDFNWSETNRKHFVQTNDETGLDERAVEKALRLLLGEQVEEKMDKIDKEWAEVEALIRDKIGEQLFETYFKDVKPIGVSLKNNKFLLSAPSFIRVAVENNIILLTAFEKAIKVVFGEDIAYYIEGVDVNEKAEFIFENYISDTNTRSSKICYDLFSTYNDWPEIKLKKQMSRVSKIIREFPEHIFGTDKDIELFNRLVLTFANTAKVSGTKNVSLTRTGDKFLEFYSKDIFLIDRISDEKMIFSKSDFERFVIRNYNKKRRYLPAPLLDSQQSYPDVFYPNVDVFFTLFCIINSSPIVEIETVKDGIGSKVVFEHGLNLSRTIETLPSDKKDGSYITYKTSITNEEIYTVLERMAFFYKDICSFTFFEKHGPRTWITFNNKKDIGHYLDERTNPRFKSYWGKHKASGKDRYNKNFYKASVEFALNFDDKANVVETYYNYSLLSENNVFSDKIYEEVTRKINEWILNKAPGRSISVSDVKTRCNILINILTDDEYEEVTIKRNSPDSRTMINDMITDIFEEDFEYFLDCYPSEVIDFVLDICKNKAEQAIENVFLDGMK